MRPYLSVVLCTALSGVSLFAQSSTPQAPVAGEVQTTTQNPQAPSGQPQDSDEPVLKRRTPEQRQGQEPSAPSNGPVVESRSTAPTRISMAQTVPAATEFSATLDEELSSKKTQPGDGFTATLNSPLRNQHGDILLQPGMKIRGVVQNSESGKVLASIRGKGRLSLRFTEIQLPDGRFAPLQASLVGVSGTRGHTSTSQEGEITGGISGKDTAKDIGIGAGVGTIAGMIFGSTLKGLAIGAIAGGGYVLANAGKDVTLPARTVLNLRMDQYLTIPASTVAAQP